MVANMWWITEPSAISRSSPFRQNPRLFASKTLFLISMAAARLSLVIAQRRIRAFHSHLLLGKRGNLYGKSVTRSRDIRLPDHRRRLLAGCRSRKFKRAVAIPAGAGEPRSAQVVSGR